MIRFADFLLFIRTAQHGNYYASIMCYVGMDAPEGQMARKNGIVEQKAL